MTTTDRELLQGAGKTYTLWTIQDMLAVPPERRSDMFKELELALSFYELCVGDEQQVSMKPIVWTDDGDASFSLQANDVTLQLQVRAAAAMAGEGE